MAVLTLSAFAASTEKFLMAEVPATSLDEVTGIII
ncbi:hypothetical protein SDC9_188142 [bioreactor metagenome]|uniref:Uncharacterized protein n=1 Tax=bioreactor metagenome TaxID=1076179 RepID=A0A645HWP2_9ZZZZ